VLHPSLLKEAELRSAAPAEAGAYGFFVTFLDLAPVPIESLDCPHKRDEEN